MLPIAFHTATLAALVAYVGTQEARWYRVAMIAAWLTMVIAASLIWMLVQTHRAGAKASFLHAARATREPELSVAILNVAIYDALADNLVHVGRRRFPAAKEAPPLPMHS